MKKIIFAFLIFIVTFGLFSCGNEEINISFDTNGGTYVNDVAYKNGGDLELPENPIKEGYTFEGWYFNKEYTEKFNVILLSDEDIVLYAKWAINQYTISFDTDGGNEIKSITQNYGFLIENIEEPLKEGYTFLGWDQVVPLTMPAKDLDFKAIWQINQYEISFDTDGGTPMNNIIFDYGATVNISEVPIKVGYDFKGWDLKQPFNMPSSNISLRALWQIKVFNLNVNYLGSINEKMDFIKVSEGEKHTLALNEIGEVYSWGDNYYGQLGNGTNNEGTTPINITHNFNLMLNEIIIDISAGGFHSVALTSLGRIFTWGKNTEQQLGYLYYNSDLNFLPYDITESFSFDIDETVTNIESGYYYSILSTNVGRVFAWGTNDTRTIPDDEIIDLNMVTDVSEHFHFTSNEHIKKISISISHIIFLTSNNRILTWGHNYNGQLGDGTKNTRLLPIDITQYFILSSDESFVDIASGAWPFYSAAITSLGNIYMWGNNEDVYPKNITTSFNLLEGKKITCVTGGNGNPIFKTTNNRIFTFMEYDSNRIVTVTGDIVIYPIDATDITDKFLVRSDEHIEVIYKNTGKLYVITDDGRLIIWGDNSSSNLANSIPKYFGTGINISNSFNLNNEEYIVSIENNGNHHLALTSEKRLITWGANDYFQLGVSSDLYKGQINDITANFSLEINEEIYQISNSNYHNIVLTSKGRVFTWGANHHGFLGDGTTIANYLPVDITSYFGLFNNETIIRIASGYMHSIAISSLGRIFTWGDNGNNNLGDGTTITRYLPYEITEKFNFYPEETVVDVRAGWNTIVLTSVGRVFTWGHNDLGQLGDGTFNSSNLPIDITSKFTLETNEVVSKIFMNRYHSIILTSDGRVFVWGYSTGTGLGYNSNLPIDITSKFTLNQDESIINILAGEDYSIATTSKNRIYVWGYNSNYQLGYDTPLLTSEPLEIKYKFNFEDGETINTLGLGGLTWYVSTTHNNIIAIGYNQLIGNQLVDGVAWFEPQHWLELNEVEVLYGEDVPFPVFEDKKVLCWFFDPEFTQPYFGKTMIGDLTLYPLFA